MRICVLASGSKGNCIYVEGDQTKILIDAGISKTEIEKRLSLININPSEIDSILITHEHSDHIAGVGNFARKYGCKIFAHKDIWPILEPKIGDLKSNQEIEFSNSPFLLNELNINAFDVDHDALHCVGFSVGCNNKKFSTATDLGHTTPEIIKHLYTSDAILLEANHDIEMLKNNPRYPYTLKQRILSNHGHLSNEATAKAIIEMLGKNVRGIMLGHLSEDNNSPQKATETIQRIFNQNNITEKQNIVIDVATQHRVSRIFKIKE